MSARVRGSMRVRVPVYVAGFCEGVRVFGGTCVRAYVCSIVRVFGSTCVRFTVLRVSDIAKLAQIDVLLRLKVW